MSVIHSIPGIAPVQSPFEGARTEKSQELGGTFMEALRDAQQTEHTSTQMAEKFAHGDPSIGIHEVMIASEKANVSLRFATTLKNKALEAYRELMNTQV